VGKRSSLRKTCLSDTLCTTNSTWSSVGLNPNPPQWGTNLFKINELHCNVVMSSCLIVRLWNLTYWTSYVLRKISVCKYIYIYTLLSLYCTLIYIYILKLFFIPLFICIFIRFVLLEFFLSSLVCFFLLFRSFVMFTYTAVCLNLCSSSFSAGRARTGLQQLSLW